MAKTITVLLNRDATHYIVSIDEGTPRNRRGFDVYEVHSKESGTEWIFADMKLDYRAVARCYNAPKGEDVWVVPVSEIGSFADLKFKTLSFDHLDFSAKKGKK